MNHPFDWTLSELKTVDLEFEESLTVEETNDVEGGLTYTTLAIGEEGGDWAPVKPPHWPFPPSRPPIKFPIHPPIEPPIVTTLALGEEGGDWYI